MKDAFVKSAVRKLKMGNSLFSSDDLVEEKKEPKSRSLKTKSKKIDKKIGLENSICSDVIGKLEKDSIIQFVTKGEWSTHDLIFHILNQIGSAELTIATWSVTSPVVSQIANMIDKGMITKLDGLFDWRMKVRCPEAEQFMKFNCANIRLVNCHAKVTVIKNDNWSITIVGSANLTNNPRIESGVIFTDKETADFNLEWMRGELKDGKRFTE